MESAAFADEVRWVRYHAETFAGRPIRDYDPERAALEPGAAWRIRAVYRGPTFLEQLDALAKDRKREGIEAIVFGYTGRPGGLSQCAELAARAGSFPALRAVFVGDVEADECEASWLETDDFAFLLGAFPKLEVLRVNGNPRCNAPSSPSLTHLALQTAASGELVRQLAAADLPSLRHLEVWLGADDYGGSTRPPDLLSLLAGKALTSLRHLGLRNAEHADAVARVVADSPLLDRLEGLDLSLGTLSDAGAEALLASPAVAKLRYLDVSHNYLSEALREKLLALGLPTCKADPGDADQDEDDDGTVYRYVAVGE